MKVNGFVESKGHLAFAGGSAGTVEFFTHDGAVYRAPVSNAIMPDGYRTGRFECSLKMFENFRGVILNGFDWSA